MYIIPVTFLLFTNLEMFSLIISSITIKAWLGCISPDHSSLKVVTFTLFQTCHDIWKIIENGHWRFSSWLHPTRAHGIVSIYCVYVFPKRSSSCKEKSFLSLSFPPVSGWLKGDTSKDQRDWIQYLILLTILSSHLIPRPIQQESQIFHTLTFDLPVEYLVALYTIQKIQLLVGFGFPKTISECSRSFSKLPVPSSTSYSLSCYVWVWRGLAGFPPPFSQSHSGTPSNIFLALALCPSCLLHKVPYVVGTYKAGKRWDMAQVSWRPLGKEQTNLLS